LNRNLDQDPSPQPAITSATVKAKTDHEQNFKDAARLAQLATEIKQELETGGEFTLSLGTLKKTEEMQKLSKSLHTRMKADYASAPKPPAGMDATQRTKH
jgi:hypothetical protein